MADKKKIISLEVDTGTSKQDLAALGDGFKQVSREAGQLDATFDDIYGDMKPLTGRMGELEVYKDKPVIVVCRMGTSASAAVKQLRAAGFSQAQRMAGGMMTWDEQRLPVTKK